VGDVKKHSTQVTETKNREASEKEICIALCKNLQTSAAGPSDKRMEMGSLECPQVVVGVEDRGTLDSLINASLQ
jgi:hypothetical protein